ncbi:haloalkane dehalogenase family protein [Planoprotostelium fungivorum]|uniref:Haloalkane dehalogenase family protein n=1 Tax=Planoprotostelium fungivorum TaxID=1890364 RepID=A0A2P6N584_9EUKA|nr:haloalkane dehalogenase family protein [Planoprotostelium fungivorum]
MFILYRSKRNHRLRDTIWYLIDGLQFSFFTIFDLISSSTLIRLLLVTLILPFYIIRQLLDCSLDLLSNLPYLYTSNGRGKLVACADRHREITATRASQQYAGEYIIRGRRLETRLPVRGECPGWVHEPHYLRVCGARAAYYRIEAEVSAKKKKTFVLLHGNLSWSYAYRNIIPRILAEGHDVVALDMIGFGMSDRLMNPDEISVELHAHTVETLINNVVEDDCVVVAHGWGGTMIELALPHIKRGKVGAIFFVSSFFAPRVDSYITLNQKLLHLFLYMVTGVLYTHTPDWIVLLYMVPSIRRGSILGFSWPYRHQPSAARTSVYKLARSSTDLPRWMYKLREAYAWRLFEGVIGPKRCDGFHQQARIADLDDEIIKTLSSEKSPFGMRRAVVACGTKDTISSDSTHQLHEMLPHRLTRDFGGKVVKIEGAGHYPLEERDKRVHAVLMDLVDKL